MKKTTATLLLALLVLLQAFACASEPDPAPFTGTSRILVFSDLHMDCVGCKGYENLQNLSNPYFQ